MYHFILFYGFFYFFLTFFLRFLTFFYLFLPVFYLFPTFAYLFPKYFLPSSNLTVFKNIDTHSFPFLHDNSSMRSTPAIASLTHLPQHRPPDSFIIEPMTDYLELIAATAPIRAPQSPVCFPSNFDGEDIFSWAERPKSFFLPRTLCQKFVVVWVSGQALWGHVVQDVQLLLSSAVAFIMDCWQKLWGMCRTFWENTSSNITLLRYFRLTFPWSF